MDATIEAGTTTPKDDFPYYLGAPVALSAAKWAVVLVACAIALAIVILPPPFFRGTYGQLGPAILLAAIPLGALIFVAPTGWTAIFRRLRPIDFGWMLLFAVLNIVITLLAGAIMVGMTETTRNAAVVGLSDAGVADQVMLFVRAIPQLFGEELISILPFLAMLTLFTWLGVGRILALVLALLLTGVLFAGMHLPTYGFNVVQTLLGVGIARLVLTIPYIMTKNILVCTGAHILNDWLFFGFVMVGSGLASATAGA